MGLLLATLFAVYAAGTIAALLYLWRRLERVSRELAEVRRAAGMRAPAQVVRRAGSGSVVPVEDAQPESAAPDDGPWARAARTWGVPTAQGADGAALTHVVFSPANLRGLTLGMLATAPALGFFFHADATIIVAAGLAIAAAMMVIALRPVWTLAAWASVSTAGAWASLGFALGAAHADPTSYSICIAFAGAMSLRLEAMHLAAFGAAVIGLFVLSGQPIAAIWFTPVTSWAGALFLAIAVIRVPQLGSRGVAIAGTGAFGALGAILALNTAQHGLAHPYAAAGALVALAAMLAGIIASAAMRRARGLQALRFSLWLLALAGFLAIAAAIVLALPAPPAALAFALVALGFIALNGRFPEGVWRTFTGAAALAALPHAVASAQMLLSEAPGWPAWLLVAVGLCAPAALLAFAARLASRQEAPNLAALLEMLVIGLAVAAVSLFVRLIFSDGALRLQPVGFVETGVHSAAWLTAALIIGSRAHLGAATMRVAATNLLMLAALGVMGVAGLLWTTDYWVARSGAGPDVLTRDTLGFVLPAVLFFAHWGFWRARADHLQTRLAFGASMLLLAAFITVEALRAENFPDWGRALAGALSFATALGVNFAPGVVSADGAPRRRHLEKDLHRDRRRQQRRKTRQRAGQV